MQLAWRVDEGSKVRLKDYDPDFVDKYTDRALASAEIEKLSEELGELQQLLAAAQHHSLLIVLQGMDTSGKDGTIRHVMAQVNPLGCEVRSFKGPTSRERVHDFLWRIHRVVPGRGMISIFNRSHYADEIARCSTDEAPWYIVPANRKWYRNLLVVRTLVSTLRPFKKEWQAKLVKRGEQELARIEKLQQAGDNPVEVKPILHS